MNRLLKLTALCVLAPFTVMVAAIAQPSDAAAPSRNKSFKAGEHLTYHIYYNMGFVWINAGNVNFNIKNENLLGHKTFHITSDGKTAKNYEWFFKVDDKYETFLDRETLLPVKFLRNVHEGSIKIKNDVSFYHPFGYAISDTTKFPIQKYTQDILSAIYFARTINYDKYSPGDKIPFSLFLDNTLYGVYIKYLGKEEITTKMGTFKAIKIAPLLIKGTIFKDGDKMEVWVSDDDNHVPLRVSSPIIVGSIKADLMGYDELRNTFTSMVSEN